MDARKRRIKHKQQRKRGTSHCPFYLTYLDHIEHRIYINTCNVVLLIRGVIARPADQFMNTERERGRERCIRERTFVCSPCRSASQAPLRSPRAWILYGSPTSNGTGSPVQQTALHRYNRFIHPHVFIHPFIHPN